jgi:site-specific recombinase XerC
MALKEAPMTAGLVVVERPREIRIVDAFNEVLAQTKRGEKSRHDWNYYVRRFLGWLAKHYRDAVYWHLLNRQIVREYLATYDGKSATMRRLSLQPICQTSGYLHREYGLVNFAERLGIGSKLEKTPCEVYIEDVTDFLDYLQKNEPRLEVGAALQGLAGLQLQEATRLTWDRVDLNLRLVEISGDVKNVYRNRVIPVAKRVHDALRRANALRNGGDSKVMAVRGHVLLSKKGFPYGKWWENYTKEVLRALRKWNPKIAWKPKDLRNCLPTFAVTHGLQSDVWEQYIGHVPRSVTAKHYIPRLASGSLGESNALDRQMQLFRFHVTEQVDRAVATGSAPRILNFFEPTPLQPADEFKIAARNS